MLAKPQVKNHPEDLASEIGWIAERLTALRAALLANQEDPAVIRGIASALRREEIELEHAVWGMNDIEKRLAARNAHE